MSNILEAFFSLVLLKILEIFEPLLEKKVTQKQPSLGVLQDGYPEKLLKFHKKTTALQLLFIKVSRNEETPAQVLFCEFSKVFKNTFLTEHIL